MRAAMVLHTNVLPKPMPEETYREIPLAQGFLIIPAVASQALIPCVGVLGF